MAVARARGAGPGGRRETQTPGQGRACAWREEDLPPPCRARVRPLFYPFAAVEWIAWPRRGRPRRRNTHPSLRDTPA